MKKLLLGPSLWAASVFFAFTPNMAKAQCITVTAPWTEDFEGPNFALNNTFDSCWTTIPASALVYSWWLETDNTSSSGTGPSADHTTGLPGTGQYIYTEASWGSTGDTAEIYTPLIDISGITNPALRFWKHFYGADIDSFFVEVDAGSGFQTVYQTQGDGPQTDETDPWVEEEVDLNAFAGSTALQIRFRAISAGCCAGDMALDDISVDVGSPCPKPSAISVVSVGLNDVTLDWVPGSGTSWEVAYGAPGFHPDSAVGSPNGPIGIVPAGTHPFTVTGLTASTAYDFYVREACALWFPGGNSGWRGPAGTYTNCGTVTAPWSDSFETGLSPCWIQSNTDQRDWQQNSGGTSSSSTGPSAANDGSQYIYVETSGSSAGDKALIQSPEVDITTLTNPALVFDYHMYGAGMGWFHVMVDSANTGNMDTLFAIYGDQGDQWNNLVLSLSGYEDPATGAVSVHFELTVDDQNGNAYENDLALDHVRIEQGPACLGPAFLTATANSSSAAGVSFSPIDPTAMGWEIEYGPQGYTAGSGTVISVTSPNATITGLSPGTCYDFRVREACASSPGSFSPWSAPATACTFVVPPYFEPFTMTYDDAEWEEASGLIGEPTAFSGSSSNWTDDGFGNVGFDGSAKLNIWTTTTDEWTFTPVIELNSSAQWQLEFDWTCREFGSPTLAGIWGPDDTVYVVISTDAGATWNRSNALLMLDSTAIANAGTDTIHEVIDISMYAGNNIRIGFYGESTISNEDTDFFIDNVRIDGLSTLCAAVTAPWTEDFEGAPFAPLNTLDSCWTTIPVSGSGYSWYVETDNTSSSGTGPSADHTTGVPGTGQYIYTEATGSSAGDTAEIRTPLIDISGITNPALRFWKHFYGADIDSFFVEVDTGSGFQTIYQTQGDGPQTDETDPWVEEVLDLNPFAGSTALQIRFRAIRGANFAGDMALDDISVDVGPPCFKPSAISVVSFGATDVTLDWVPSSGTSWEVAYGAPGFHPDSAVGSSNGPIGILPANTHPFLVAGLTANTEYHFYVREACATVPGANSGWRGPAGTLTNCAAVTAPWSDSFETGLSPCWIQSNTDQRDWQQNSGGTSSSNTGPSAANDGSQYIYVETSGSSAGDKALIQSPPVDITTITNPALVFDYHMYGAGMGWFHVMVDSANTGNMDTLFAIYGDQGDQWNSLVLSLAGYEDPATGAVAAQFELTVDAQNGFAFENDLALDHVRIEQGPACFGPAFLTATANSSSAAGVSFSPIDPTAMGWEIEYGPQGYTAGSGTVISVTSPNATITGLSPGTCYDFRVREACTSSPGSFSPWSAPATACTFVVPPYFEPFTMTYDDAEWEEASGLIGEPTAFSGSSSNWTDDGFGNVGFDGSAKLNIWTTTTDEWTFTPVIELDSSAQWQLEFDWTCREFGSPTLAGIWGPDDTVYVVISTDAGATWNRSNALLMLDSTAIANAGTDTIHEVIDISMYAGNNIRIGFYGESTVSNEDTDFFIDNVRIDGLSSTLCATVTAPWTEDFEGPNFALNNTFDSCWTTIPASALVYSWWLETDNTSSSSTGPSADHTTGVPGTGQYIYTEASWGSAGDTAEIRTPLIDISGITNPALRFWKHFYGADIDSFFVEVDAGSGFQTVYQTQGDGPQTDEADVWVEEVLDLNPFAGSTALQIRFRAISAGCCAGDMALDDISVDVGPPCFKPSAISVVSFGATDVTLDWVPSSGTSWEVAYGAPGFHPDSAVGSSNGPIGILPANTHPFLVAGLTANTEYHFYVREACATVPGANSEWRGPAGTLTNCAAVTAPWSDSFETGLSTCWIQSNTDQLDWQQNSGGTSSSNTGPSAANDGSQYIYVETSGSSAGDKALIQSPPVDITTITNPALVFDYHMYGAGMGWFHVMVDSANTGNMDTLFAIYGDQGDQWNSLVLSLAGYEDPATGAVAAQFELTVDAQNGFAFENDLALDHVRIQQGPACFGPAFLTATANSSSAASVSFNPLDPAATGWEVEFGPPGYTAGSGTVVSVTSPNATITGLSPGTCYDFRVREACASSPGSFSPWSNAATACTFVVPPYFEPFTVTYDDAEWEEASGLIGEPTAFSGSSSNWIDDGFGNVGFDGSAKLNIWTTTTDEWTFTPVIELDSSVQWQLEFDWTCREFGSSTLAGIWGPDDTVYVVISTDAGATWNRSNALLMLDSTAIANAGTNTIHEVIDISMYAGNNIRIGFYGESTVSNEDTDFFIDNVRIDGLSSTLIAGVDSSGLVAIACNGGTASVTVTVSGGTPPYSYLWSDGSITPTATLSAGIYAVTVSDSGTTSLPVTVTLTITEPDQLTVSAGSVTHVSCFGGNDGAIAAVSVSGGTPPYSYLWNTGDITPGLNNLSTGVYQVTVTDANGCPDTTSMLFITQPLDSLFVSAGSVTHVSCFGGNDGALTLAILGGTPPYSYLWNTGNSTSSLSNLTAGTYQVTLTDDAGCTQSSTVNITQPAAALAAIFGATDISCHGASDGSIDVTVSGGTSPYSYLWNTGDMTPTLSNLMAGAYQVTVTDASGCVVISNQLVVTEPAELIVIGNSPPNSGTAMTSISGGTPPYSYLWNTGDITPNLTNLTTAGLYRVTVTDANGCSDTAEIDVIVGMEELNFARYISLYPNPTAEEVFIDYDFTGEVDLEVTVVNHLGQVVLTISEPNAISGKLRLDVVEWANGVYSVLFSNGSQSNSRQLVIQK